MDTPAAEPANDGDKDEEEVEVVAQVEGDEDEGEDEEMVEVIEGEESYVAAVARGGMHLHISKRSATGYRGVYLQRRSGRFEAHHSGTYLGTFVTVQEASIAYARHMQSFGMASSANAGSEARQAGKRERASVDDAPWGLNNNRDANEDGLWDAVPVGSDSGVGEGARDVTGAVTEVEVETLIVKLKAVIEGPPGMTQSAAAEAMGVHKSYLSQWLSRKLPSGGGKAEKVHMAASAWLARSGAFPPPGMPAGRVSITNARAVIKGRSHREAICHLWDPPEAPSPPPPPAHVMADPGGTRHMAKTRFQWTVEWRQRLDAAVSQSGGYKVATPAVVARVLSKHADAPKIESVRYGLYEAEKKLAEAAETKTLRAVEREASKKASKKSEAVAAQTAPLAAPSTTLVVFTTSPRAFASGMDGVREMLEWVRLPQYADAFDDNGWDDMAFLAELEPEALHTTMAQLADDCDMKSGHKRKLCTLLPAYLTGE